MKNEYGQKFVLRYIFAWLNSFLHFGNFKPSTFYGIKISQAAQKKKEIAKKGPQN